MEIKGNFLLIDLDKCFECGKPMDELHHVVPRSKGGVKTIPLCTKCHGNAHGMKRRITSSDLIKDGMKVAKANGKHIGRFKGTIESKEIFLNKHNDIIIELKNGLSIRSTCLKVGKSLGTVAKVRKYIKYELNE